MSWFDKMKKTFHLGSRKEVPGALWLKCDSCGAVLLKEKVTDNLWVCDKCNGTYKTAEEAEKCEGRHRDVDGFTITSASYADCSGSYGLDLSFKAQVPKGLVVRFSDERNDFATYTLGRCGPRGM